MQANQVNRRHAERHRRRHRDRRRLAHQVGVPFLKNFAAAMRRQQAAGKAKDRADIFSAGTLVTAKGGHGTQGSSTAERRWRTGGRTDRILGAMGLLKAFFSWAHSNWGRDYARAGDYDQAIADFTDAIRLDPNNADTYVQRALAYGEKGEHEKAVADCTQAIQLDPKNAKAFCWRGANLVDLGRYDEPIADLTEAIRLEPNLAAAFVFRGIARSKHGFAKQLVSEFDGAIADFTEAIGIDPNYANAYQKRAMAYGGKLEHDRAIADSSAAIRLDPKNFEAYFSRGVAYKYKKEYDKAASDFTRAIALKPSNVLYQLRAQAYRALGEEAKANSDERKAQAPGK